MVESRIHLPDTIDNAFVSLIIGDFLGVEGGVDNSLSLELIDIQYHDLLLIDMLFQLLLIDPMKLLIKRELLEFFKHAVTGGLEH